MKRCEDCKRTFPDHLIAFMRWDIRPLEIYPICALKIRNKIHDLQEGTPFTGEMAQAMYEEAIKFIRHVGGPST